MELPICASQVPEEQMYLCKLGTSLHDENFLERDDVPFVVCLGKNTFGDDVRKYSWISVLVEKECGWFCLWTDQCGWLKLSFDQINNLSLLLTRSMWLILPLTRSSRRTWEPFLFHLGRESIFTQVKKHFLDAEASLAQGPGHRRSLWKPELEQIVHFCASQSSNSI